MIEKSPTHLRAIGYALASFTIWAFADVLFKLMRDTSLPVYEILGIWGIGGVIIIYSMAMLRGETKQLWPKKPGMQIARACVGISCNFFNVVAFKHLSLTMFYLIVFTAPMVIALLAALFLREHLTTKKVIAIVAGFIGVVIAINPLHAGVQGDWNGYLFVGLSTITFAVNIVWIRTMTQKESPMCVAFFSAIVASLVGVVPMVVWHFEPVTFALLGGLFAISIFETAGNLANFYALKHTTAANVSQCHYFQLIIGAIAGYLIWHDKPTWNLFFGAVVIIGAGIYMANHARQAEKQAEAKLH